MNKKVYIVILNWNGWKDTIECLESVFRSKYNNYKVIVCDNCSNDGSIEKIRQWADGKLKANITDDPRIAFYTSPAVEKPLQYLEYTREQVENGELSIDEPPLILIQTGKNLGFAGGNNVGMRYALAKSDFDYIWLLNNDTVVQNDTLLYLLEHVKGKPQMGICGSTLLFYDNPDKVQAFGGAVYNSWLALSNHIGLYQDYNVPVDYLEIIEKKMDYVVGASMLVKREFLLDIGLMCEDYFLYYEEVDWAIRAKKKYVLGYAPSSIVYHKEGASIGSSSNPLEKSFIADFYANKNRVVFTKKYYPWLLPVVYSSLLISIVNRIRRRQWSRVIFLIKILFSLGEYRHERN
ncbi:glycosyltransferase family 2 protein [Pelosinus baikalensis]|uniref:Glycosyltransferase family 2 protein n=1 Tax=Pelosinus baikalensis TaxID=2892015 RepID=A0ABS8HLS8_9FIRM|nr:glycosyltransferase family 2 protein [Pelosinus baikalensis]MCC5464131.1 glycosyltransferase family 2 protein [Pelosinus baikalensis]